MLTKGLPLWRCGFIERLWQLLKYEDVYLKGYVDGHQARAGIAVWVNFYNIRRPHQTLGNRPPMTVWRAGVTSQLGGTAADMMLRLDNADALPGYHNVAHMLRLRQRAEPIVNVQVALKRFFKRQIQHGSYHRPIS